MDLLTDQTRHDDPQPERSRATAVPALLGFIVAAQAAGIVGVVFTERGAWYDRLDKPPFNPPTWVFSPVWTTLYVMMAIAASLVWRAPVSTPFRRTALQWWWMQLALNAAWTLLFFGARSLGAALIEIGALWVAIGACIVRFRPISPAAAWLMVPYLAWVTFATVLNASIFLLN